MSEIFITGDCVTSGGMVRYEGAAGQHDSCDRLIADLRKLLAERDAADQVTVSRDDLLLALGLRRGVRRKVNEEAYERVAEAARVTP